MSTILATRASGEAAKEAEQWSRPDNQDLEALTTLPLHAVPAPSLLQKSFLTSRLVGLPKRNIAAGQAAGCDTETESFVTSKKMQKYKNLFRQEPKESEEIDLKSFSKLLKTSVDQ